MNNTKIRGSFKDQNLKTVLYQTVIDAVGTKPFKISVFGKDKASITKAIKQGIDSYLEAIQFTEILHTKHQLVVEVAPQSMPVLLRRLFETGADNDQSLAGDIMTILTASPEETEPVDFEGYAASWGDDRTEDGIMFYNFSVDGHDKEFLGRFVPVIERTIIKVDKNPETWNPNEVDTLNELKEECVRRMKGT